jgi:hypothetical protein
MEPHLPVIEDPATVFTMWHRHLHRALDIGTYDPMLRTILSLLNEQASLLLDGRPLEEALADESATFSLRLYFLLLKFPLDTPFTETIWKSSTHSSKKRHAEEEEEEEEEEDGEEDGEEEEEEQEEKEEDEEEEDEEEEDEKEKQRQQRKLARKRERERELLKQRVNEKFSEARVVKKRKVDKSRKCQSTKLSQFQAMLASRK